MALRGSPSKWGLGGGSGVARSVEILGGIWRPLAEARVAITAKKYKCPQKNLARTCVCEGSPLNCELPNDQPGRNRYLPPAFLAEAKARGAKIGDVLDAGRWEVALGTVLHDGEGKVRGAFRSACLPWAAPTGTALAKDDSRVCPKINFGQFKNMRADGDTAMRTYVYAFNVYVGGVIDSSGWIRLDSVVDKAGLKKMRHAAPRRVRSFVPTKYVVKSRAEHWSPPSRARLRTRIAKARQRTANRSYATCERTPTGDKTSVAGCL